MTILHSFVGADGRYPRATLVADASGTCTERRTAAASTTPGTVFRLDAANDYALTTLHDFAAPTEPALSPRSSPTPRATSTERPPRGGTFDYGTVFKLDAANGYARTTLHSFDGPDGAEPSRRAHRRRVGQPLRNDL